MKWRKVNVWRGQQHWVHHPGREVALLAPRAVLPFRNTHTYTYTYTHSQALCWRKTQWRPGVAWVTKGPVAGGGRGGSWGGAGGGAGLAGNGDLRAEASELGHPVGTRGQVSAGTRASPGARGRGGRWPPWTAGTGRSGLVALCSEGCSSSICSG